VTIALLSWREDRAVTYSEIADWSGYWGPITIHYHLTRDWVPSLSPLRSRRDYGRGILTRLHTGEILNSVLENRVRTSASTWGQADKMIHCCELGLQGMNYHRSVSQLLSPGISWDRAHVLLKKKEFTGPRTDKKIIYRSPGLTKVEKEPLHNEGRQKW
jgi:hypothetical protein